MSTTQEGYQIFFSPIEGDIPNELMPRRGHPSDSGIDIFYTGEDIEILPGANVKLHTNLRVLIPTGYDMVLHNRSSVASKYGLILGAHVIDAGYTGEIIVNLINVSSTPYQMHTGDKIVQGIVRRVELPTPVVIDKNSFESMISNTGRGTHGFGSTGK